MKSLVGSAMAIGLGMLGWASVEPAAAQTTPPSAAPDSVETVVVTAQKREEKITDVPMSVTALSGNLLDALQTKDFSDFAPLVPGLSLASSQPGLTRLTLRGQNTGGVGSTVGVYVDESPFGSSTALSNGATNTGDFDTWDVQRIEVLRGPQGTLYGSNSEGGLLKYVTTPPALGVLSVATQVSGESVDGGSSGGDVRGLLNLPIGAKAALRVSAFDQDVPGYIDDPSLGATRINDGHKFGGRASLLAMPVDELSIRLTATSQRARYNDNNVVDIDPTTLAPVHGELSQQRFIPEPSQVRYDNYNGTVSWNVGAFNVLSSTSYGVINTDTVSDYTSIVLVPPSTTLGDELAAAIGPGLAGRLDDNVQTKKFTEEVRVASRASDKWEWLVGAYYTHETANLIEHLDAVSSPSGAGVGLPSLEIPTIASDYKEYAGFASVTYHFSPQFEVQAGGRYSKNQQTAIDGLSGLLVATQGFSGKSDGNVFTYSLAPQWHLNADTMLYARLATGYRPGGPNVLPPGAPPGVPRAYDADKTTNGELGVRSTLLDRKLSIDVAAFYVHWTDVQLLEEIENSGVNANGGTARSDGVEWTIDYVPVQGLTLQWNGAYTDASLTSPAPAINAASGDPLPYVPKWSTALDGEYSWGWFSGFKGFLGSTWSYVGARSTDFGSTPSGGQLSLRSYNTFAARVGIDNSRLRLTLYMKNIGDARGITSYTGSTAPGLNGIESIIQPRTVGFTVTAKF